MIATLTLVAELIGRRAASKPTDGNITMTGTSIDVGAPSQVDLDMRSAYGSTLGHAAWAAHTKAQARQDEAAWIRAEADDYAAKVRAEADRYAAKIRAEADDYAAKSRVAADALGCMAAAAKAAAAAMQREAETALAAYREATAQAVQAKAHGDARAATFNRKIAELHAFVDEALGKR